MKKHHICEKDYVWNPSTFTCENGKYLVLYLVLYLLSVMDNSMIICDEVIDADTKLSPKNYDYKINFDIKKVTYKTQNYCILLPFLLINIVLL